MKAAPGEFNFVAFHRRRRLRKAIGLGLVLGGLFVLLNMMGELPEEPLKGRAAIFGGMVLLIFGFIALYKGYKLPLEAALDIVHRKSRGITASELVHEMRVDRPTAQRIITALIRKGFLRPATDPVSEAEEVFEAVR